MDVLYDNLDNYNEERTIAELRRENSELKYKLEEYSTALNKLQKEFDMLSSEHKKLEVNYSSLLKTARAEIERKTAIITKLNIEKDAMVLNSIQNRNAPHFNRKFCKDVNTSKEESKLGKSRKCSPVGRESNKSSLISNHSNERKTDNISPENTQSSCKSRLLELANNIIRNQPETRSTSTRNNEVKENIVVKDEMKSRAPIRNRRKSMPAFSMEKLSTDEEDVGHAGSPKDFNSKEYSERSHRDKLTNDKPNSTDRTGYRDSSREAQRSRHGKHFESDKYRGRDRYDSSQRYKRNQSPDRHRRRSRDRSEEKRQKSEYDRRRRFDSPTRDKYNHQRSRDSVRSTERNHSEVQKNHRDLSNERNHLQESERHQSLSQERHATKHKILHDYEETSCKRIRTESHKHEEDRWKNERQVAPVERHELFEQLNDMSCRSPDDHIYSEPHPSNQTREIKLHATMKLDDPRISSKKYVLKTCDGRPELFTVDSANVDVRVIDKSGWEMLKEQVKMPDALIQKPSGKTDCPVKIMNINVSVKDASNWEIKKSKTPDALIHQPDHVTELSTVEKRNIENEINRPVCEKTKTDNTPGIENMNDLSLVERRNIELDTLDWEDQKKYRSPDNEKTDHATELSPAGRRNIEHEINTLDWENTNKGKSTVTENPKCTDDLIRDIYMDVDNISDMSSMESGELFSFDDDNLSYNRMPCAGESRKTLKSQKLGDYKIPKNDYRQSTKISKAKKPSAVEPNDNYKAVGSKNLNQQTNTKTDNDNDPIPQKDRNFMTAKEIVEEDLEMSDENTDLTEAQETTSYGKPDLDENHCTSIDKKHKSRARDHSNIEFNVSALKKDIIVAEDKEEIKSVNKNSEDISDKDTNKHKAKKKSPKLKVPRESNQNTDAAPATGKIDIERKSTIIDLSSNAPVLEKSDKKKVKECKTKKHSLNTVTVSEPLKNTEKEHEHKNLSVSSINFSTTDKSVNNKEKEPMTEEPFQSRDSAPILDKIIETTVYTDTVSTVDKPIKKKKKEFKPKEPLVNRDAATDATLTVNKPDKKKDKDPKHKEPQISKKKEKENKLKSTSLVTESAPTMPVKTKAKESKTKETNSKFSELFGDTTTSSLISLEDLGIIPVFIRPKYTPIFEDAQDAIDLNRMKAANITTSLTGKISDNTDQQDVTINVENPSVNVVIPKSNTKETDATESALARGIDQNLQLEISPIEKDAVKTVVISTGIQQQSPLEVSEAPFANDRRDVNFHVMQCVKPVVTQNNILLQALATSTPLKWQPNAFETDPVISVDSTENRDAADNLPVIDNSDSNTVDSLTNTAGQPDVRIILKRRRRKVLKK